MVIRRRSLEKMRTLIRLPLGRLLVGLAVFAQPGCQPAAVTPAPNAASRADGPGAEPLPVPLTRPEMKRALEDIKGRKPRIPLPPLSAEEQEKLGERGASYEARLRYHYLPWVGGRGGAGFSREPDPNMSLGHAFKTQLFWIVSRTNNCLY
jgi:hypothetical protein